MIEPGRPISDDAPTPLTDVPLAAVPEFIRQKRIEMTRLEAPCQYCSATIILVGASEEEKGVWRIVSECEACNTAWTSTQPSIVERLVAARLANDATS